MKRRTLLHCICLFLAHHVESLRCEGSDTIGAKRTSRERRERVDLTKMTPSSHYSCGAAPASPPSPQNQPLMALAPATVAATEKGPIFRRCVGVNYRRLLRKL